MRAPKTPVATVQPRRRNSATTVVDQRFGDVAGRGVLPGRTAALARVGVERELADDEHGKAEVGRRHGAVLGRGRCAARGSSAPAAGPRPRRPSRPTPTSDSRPGPISPTTPPSTVTAAVLTRLTTARTSPSLPGGRPAGCAGCVPRRGSADIRVAVIRSSSGTISPSTVTAAVPRRGTPERRQLLLGRGPCRLCARSESVDGVVWLAECALVAPASRGGDRRRLPGSVTGGGDGASDGRAPVRQ